jgi:hypothetical protein
MVLHNENKLSIPKLFNFVIFLIWEQKSLISLWTPIGYLQVF